jgi:hypothetical protein
MARPTERLETRHRLVLHVRTRYDVEAELQVSLDLAAAWGTELITFFVTDEASIGACQLPFPTMVGFSGGTLNVSPAQFEAAIRHEARFCRQLLATAAERSQLSWSFETLRGRTRKLLREASSAEDILVFRIDRLGLSPEELISAARELAPEQGGVILVPERATEHQGSLVTIDCSPTPPALLSHFSTSLATALRTGVSHLTLANEPISSATAAAIGGARLLLASLESPMLDDARIVRRLMSGFRRPLLLIRGD